MQHKGTVTIETPRLLLRRFRVEDAEAAFANWTSDPRVTAFLRWPSHSHVTVTQRVLAEWVAAYEHKNFYQWAIVLKEQGDNPIGSISVVERNERVEAAQIGYCIGQPWWHCGITTEAFMAVIEFLFREVKVSRIEARHDPNNPHSGAVMRNCGLHYEGTLRQADYNNQGIVDVAVYGLLAGEYSPIGEEVDRDAK